MTAPHLGPGQVVAGKYTIRALLGFTGEVATYHASSAQGDVALKLYDPAIGQRADLMSALDRKREMVKHLPLDAVTPVIDSGYDVTTSAPFSVTEYLLIPSLRRLVEMGPLSVEVVSQVVLGLARVLEAAHGIGLFHHSLKPSNIFVGPAPTYAVRVTDFSDAVVRSATPTHEAYAHSAPWWAPEQIQAGAVVGAPADVFAATVVAFYALTARSYWNSCQSSPPDLPGWQLEVMGQRVPASARAAEFGVGLNATVDGVFARALSVNQPERPRSLSEVGQVLASLGHGGVAEVKTLAFPPGGYPPAPEPSGGGASGPGYAPSGSHPGGYAAHSGPVAAGLDANAPTPGLPPFPQPKKSGGSPMVPVIMAVLVAVLLGGGAVFFLFLREGGGDRQAAAAASSSAAAAKARASASARIAGGSPSATASAAVSAAASAGSAGADDDAKVSVTVICKPDCEKVEIDGEELKLRDGQIELALLPGRHVVKASRGGYVAYRKTITVELGKAIEHAITLNKIRARRAGGRPKGKPCGGFLEPCK